MHSILKLDDNWYIFKAYGWYAIHHRVCNVGLKADSANPTQRCATCESPVPEEITNKAKFIIGY